MSYDGRFLNNVLHLIEEYNSEIDNYSEFVKNWIEMIRGYCILMQNLHTNETNNIYENTDEGETLSNMIGQYRYDQEFATNLLMMRLCELADQRDDIIHNHQNHLDQNHQHHHQHHHHQ